MSRVVVLVGTNASPNAVKVNKLTYSLTKQPDHIAPKTLVPTGETRYIHRAGGCYLTLVGSNPLFHLPQDRWPHAVDVSTITRVAAATSRLVVELTR